MGAEFYCQKVKAKSVSELTAAFSSLVSQAQYEHGHGGYTGTFAEAPGLTVDESVTFSTYNEAENYIDSKAQKWEDAIAVRVKPTDPAKEPYWVVGGVFSC